MASKNIVAKGATYNGVESITLPTSPSGTATFYEISDTTAVASDVLNSKWFYASDGTYTQGTGTGGGGGLEYETGTWTPSEDTTRGTVSFSNTHTLPPLIIMMTDCTGTDTGTGSILGFSYIDHYRQAGHLLPSRSSSGTRCGYVAHMYRSSDSGTSSGTQILTSSSDSGLDTSGTQSNYYVSSSGFHPCVNNSSRYFRAGRTYKWIAVWAPTT